MATGLPPALADTARYWCMDVTNPTAPEVEWPPHRVAEFIATHHHDGIPGFITAHPTPPPAPHRTRRTR